MQRSYFDDKKQNTVLAFLVIVSVLIILSLASDVLLWVLNLDRFSLGLVRTYFAFTLDSADSWWPINEAVQVYAADPEAGIYQTVFFEKKIKFQYPPMSLLPFVAFEKMGYGFHAVVKLMMLLSFVSIIGIILSLYRTVETSCSAIGEGEFIKGRSMKVALLAMLIIGTLTFYPVVNGYRLGQVQVFINLAICLMFMCWLENWKLLAGIMVALAAIVKPQYGLILIWALFRKEKDFSIGMLLVLIPTGIASLIVFGFQEHLDYLSTLSVMGQHGEVYRSNQSMNGLLNRLLSGMSTIEFQFYSFAPYNVIVHAGTLISTVLLLLFGLFYRPGSNKGVSAGEQNLNSALDLATMVIIATIVSPIAWSHHYATFWPILILGFLVAIKIFRKQRNWLSVVNLVLLSVSYLFVSNYFYWALDDASVIDPPRNLLQSYIYFGALILLISLTFMRRTIKMGFANIVAK